MTFSDKQIEALKAPLDKAFVKERSQAGRQLSYIEGWKAIDEANRIFGFDGWDRSTVEIRQLGDPYTDASGKHRVAYMARVRITVRAAGTATMTNASLLSRDITDIVRDGCGFGSGIDKDLGQAHESAIKEAETDAMKRALMTFGNPFGLALYDKDQKNVVDANRVTANTLIEALKLSKSEADLAQWAADNKAAIDALPGDLQDEVRHAFSVHRSGLRYASEKAA